MVSLVTMLRIQKSTDRQSERQTDIQIDKTWHVCTGDFYSEVKKSENTQLSAKRMGYRLSC